VLRGKTPIDETELLASFGAAQELHITPVPSGSKNGGVLKIILGVALIGIGFAVSGAFGAGATNWGSKFLGLTAKQFLNYGAGIAALGLAQMLSPMPSFESNEPVDSRQSYMFNGPVNVGEEGNVIPVAYGTPWCGSLVLSAGYDVKEAGA
jgi:predicted phage tail protein